MLSEFQFDGLVGPTHNYAGLSAGNIASMTHGGNPSNPRLAALEGLQKMKFVRDLGIKQALLPPHQRPALKALRKFGFKGSDEEVLARAAVQERGIFLRLCSSASAMWAANSATVVPSCDSRDSRTHFIPANLSSMFHRSLEAATTTNILKKIFSDSKYFTVHEPLPGHLHFADEGSANHTRLQTSKAICHLFAWGRSAWKSDVPSSSDFPARQTLESCELLARIHDLKESDVIFPRQDPLGIDGGSFHTDVLAVGAGSVLVLHDLAFAETDSLLNHLRVKLGDELTIYRVSEAELPLADAVKAYPFNSQLLQISNQNYILVAPKDSEENSRARTTLEKILSTNGPIKSVHYLDVRESMRNGGGPACLRLRVPLNEIESQNLGARVILTDDLYEELVKWVHKFYRDRVQEADLADPKFMRENLTALDELTQILKLDSVYDFQQAGGQGT